MWVPHAVHAFSSPLLAEGRAAFSQAVGKVGAGVLGRFHTRAEVLHVELGETCLCSSRICTSQSHVQAVPVAALWYVTYKYAID